MPQVAVGSLPWDAGLQPHEHGTPSSSMEIAYRRIGIAGAGTIGSGVAQLASSLGAETIVVAPRPGGVERAADRMRRAFDHDVCGGRISATEAQAALARLRITADYAELAGAEFVVESVSENLALKCEVLATVERYTDETCIFGTNTSSIPIAQITAGARRPGNVVGTHYFWPAHRYRLVEVARAAATSPEAVERTLAFIRWQGKTPLLVRDSPGFFTTRILMPYVSEAILLAAEGAPIEAIDQAMADFGWAMGPFRLLDAVGLETPARVYDSMRECLGPRVDGLSRLWGALQGGHTGHWGHDRETAKGFYLYPEGRQADPRVYPLIGREAVESPGEAEIALRPVWAMVNEVAHCLAEGVVGSTAEADLGAALGIGWPRSQVGPMAYARQVGAAAIVRQLEAWAAKYGPRFTPSRVLVEMQ